DCADELQVEAGLGAVGVHGVEQDLPGPELFSLLHPFDRVDAGPLAAPVGGDLETAGGGRAVDGAAHVRGEHEDLAAELLGDFADQFGPPHGRGVDADLVCSGAQEPVDVLGAAHPSPRGEGDEHLLGGAAHHVVGGLAVAAGRGDVEERQLVGAFSVVAPGQLHRVARVPQVLEVDAFDDPAPIHVQAGDDAYCQAHWATSRTVARASSRVNAPSYRAVPMMAPSTPSGTSAASARRSLRLEIPPLATTGLSVREHTSRSRSRL